MRLTKTQIAKLPASAFENIYSLRMTVSQAYGITITESAGEKILREWRTK